MTSGKRLRELIKSGAEGNFEAFHHASKEVIRQEREKKHHLLANDLEKILYGRATANKPINETLTAHLPTDRERNLPLLYVKEPFRRLDDVVLSGRMGLTSDYKLIYHSLHDIKQIHHAKLAWSSTEGYQL
ncbi:MAG: hypothetical protein B6I30_06420 [Desulfobacteraceae bacterium 4572_187]|nr:MAG: hypothetical protein B6I30_06420 [Desulfobacteraceae bacterium 4572_187]